MRERWGGQHLGLVPQALGRDRRVLHDGVDPCLRLRDEVFELQRIHTHRKARSTVLAGDARKKKHSVTGQGRDHSSLEPLCGGK